MNSLLPHPFCINLPLTSSLSRFLLLQIFFLFQKIYSKLLRFCVKFWVQLMKMMQIAKNPKVGCTLKQKPPLPSVVRVLKKRRMLMESDLQQNENLGKKTTEEGAAADHINRVSSDQWKNKKKKKMTKVVDNEREKEREVARRAIEEMKNTAGFEENMEAMVEFEKLCGCRKYYPTYTRDHYFGFLALGS